MNISFVHIVKSTCIQEAIKSVIKIAFNDEASAKYLESIVFEDGIAFSVETEVYKHTGDINTSTTYFIPTIINSSLIRVESCYSFETTRVNRNA